MDIVKSFHKALESADVIRVDGGVIISNWDAGSADGDMALEFSVTDVDFTVHCEVSNERLAETGQWVENKFLFTDMNGDKTTLEFFTLGVIAPTAAKTVFFSSETLTGEIVLSKEGRSGFTGLHSPLLIDDAEDDSQIEYNGAIWGIAETIHAHAVAGVDVTSDAYRKGIDWAMATVKQNVQ